jgi:hypothetical protein
MPKVAISPRRSRLCDIIAPRGDYVRIGQDGTMDVNPGRA